VLHRVPFDPAQVGITCDLTGSRMAWPATGCARFHPSTSGRRRDLRRRAARLLGVSTRLARSGPACGQGAPEGAELPGTGGQLAHHLVSSQRDLTLQDTSASLADPGKSWRLPVLIALELGALIPTSSLAVAPDDLRDASHALRQRKLSIS